MNQVIQGNCVELMRGLGNDFVDLTITSPPYDDLRTYNGYSFDFEGVASELYRITKKGGVVVWVVGDKTTKGSESLTSFKQALFFKEVGFNMHDTMIYAKENVFGGSGNPPRRYAQSFEYMFVLSKGTPKTFNPIKEPCIKSGTKFTGITRKNQQSDGEKPESKRYIEGKVKKEKIVKNIFSYKVGFNMTSKDKIAFQHPAIFPEKLAEDQVLSWSNERDLVFDPFAGSGTTLKMAKLHNREYLGFEISEEYCEIAKERISLV